MLGKIEVDKKKILKNKLTTVTRSLFYKRDLNKNQKIIRSDLASVRPGIGISPQKLKNIIGKD